MRSTLLAAFAACLSFGAGCASPVQLGTTVTDAQLDEATTIDNVAYYTDLSMYQGDHALKRLGVVTLHSGHSRDAMRAAEGQEGALEGILTGFVEQLAGSTPKVEVVRPEDMVKAAAVASWGPPGGRHHAPSSRLIGLAFGDDDECAAVCRETETDGVFMVSVAPARTVLVIMIPFARFKVADPDGIHPVDFNHTMTLRLDHDGALGSGEELGRLLGRAFHRFLYPAGL